MSEMHSSKSESRIRYLVRRQFPNLPDWWLETSNGDGEELIAKLESEFVDDETDMVVMENGHVTERSKVEILQSLGLASALEAELYAMDEFTLNQNFLEAKDLDAVELTPISEEAADCFLQKVYWTVYEAAVLSVGLDPNKLTDIVLQKFGQSPVADRVRKRLALLNKAVLAGDLNAVFSPRRFFDWAIVSQFVVDDTLNVRAGQSGIATPTSLNDQLLAERTRNTELEQQVFDLREAVRILRESEDDADAKLLRSLRKVALGLAISHHAKPREFAHINILSLVTKLDELGSLRVGHDAVKRCLSDAYRGLIED